MIASCGGDDSAAGTYSLIGFGATDCGDTPFTFDFSDGCDTFMGFEVCANGMLNLRDDGTFTINFSIVPTDDPDEDFFDITGSGTWEDNGNSISLCEGMDDCVDARVSGDELVVTIPDPDCNTTFTMKKN